MHPRMLIEHGEQLFKDMILSNNFITDATQWTKGRLLKELRYVARLWRVGSRDVITSRING